MGLKDNKKRLTIEFKTEGLLIQYTPLILLLVSWLFTTTSFAQPCVECHKEVTPNIISDWQLSKHSQNEVTCSVQEARQPQACQSCHMGFDHPQWEMYSASKHGVRFLLKQNKILPEDEQWKADQVTILQALGVLDPEGNPTGRLEVVKAAEVARLTQEDWQQERDKMLKVCSDCHSENFAKAELEKGDQMIKETAHLLAEAIRTIAALYKEGILKKPENYAYAFPDLLTFHDAPTPIEQKLFVMHLEHRMRAFRGLFTRIRIMRSAMAGAK